MYEERGTIAELVHLYVDGAFNRRELIHRVAKHTGSLAAAVAALAGFPEAQAQPQACPTGVSVAATDPDLIVGDVEFAGEAGKIFGHLAYPRVDDLYAPAIIVMHENRGLVDHIKDVTRRAAKAGFVALGVDLLSRQGGTASITDPQQLVAAYNRTTADQRYSDHISALTYLKTLPVVQHDRIGSVGFCAGGGNSFQFAVGLEELRAAVVFYGAPPAVETFDAMKASLLLVYAETDRALTQRGLAAAVSLSERRKVIGVHVYEGVGHAFHNDTGAAYNAGAACDAWAKTIGWFNKFLRA